MIKIPLTELDSSNVLHVPFNGHIISIASAPNGKRIDISDSLRDPSDFHGPTDVDHVINFGPAMKDLICTYAYPSDFLGDDISVLATNNSQAKSIVAKVNEIACQLITDDQLYNDPVFCRQYFDLAAKGYKLLPTNNFDQIPV